MRGYKHTSTVRQMAVSVAVFATLALLLESGGMYEWAQRLDLGPERTLAVPVAGALHWGLRWAGLERLRRKELTQLARAGWSDDAQAVAASRMESGSKTSPLAPPPPLVASASSPSSFWTDLNKGPEADNLTSDTTAPAKAVHTPPLPLEPMAGDPPLITPLPKIAAVSPGKTRTVALVGDSMMAVGLSSTLLREAPHYPDLALLRAFKSGTGLARPEVFDWQSEYPAMMAGTRPEMVVVAIGANDGQGFVEGGVTYAFGTQAWRELYQRRVQAFLAMLEANGARVVWVELPPMKNGAYDARIALVNRIDYAVVRASRTAVWFSTAGLVGDAAGRFQDFGTVRGATARLRQPDGIHFSDDGAVLLSTKLLPWLARQDRAPELPAVKETASVQQKAPLPAR